jgi:hypothetical protein
VAVIAAVRKELGALLSSKLNPLWKFDCRALPICSSIFVRNGHNVPAFQREQGLQEWLMSRFRDKVMSR